MRRREVLFTLLCAALLSAIAAPQAADAATTLHTPAIGFTSGPVTCLAVNVSKAPVAVLIEQFDIFGNLSNHDTITLDPGEGWAFNGGAGEAFYCKFTFKGAKRAVRGSACMAGGGGCVSAQ